MAFDGLITKHIVAELSPAIIGGKINKISEPNGNEIILSIYSNGINYSLNLSIAVDSYRANLTTHQKKNPINAAGFCMLLRKHLIGAKIKKIYTLGLERIIYIDLETYNELNDLVEKKLIVELMGKHSNIILTNANSIIIDSLRHLSTEDNSTRNILPARTYELPENNKIELSDIKTFDEFYKLMQNANNIDKNNNKPVETIIASKISNKFADDNSTLAKDNKSVNTTKKVTITNVLADAISTTFIGISKTTSTAIIENLNLSNEFSTQNLKMLYTHFQQILKNIGTNQLSLITYNNDFALAYQPHEENLQGNFFIDDFYTHKENNILFTNYRNNILRLVSSTLARIQKKLLNINNKIKDCENMDIYKLYGELLTANLYKYPEFTDDSVTLENYYDNNNLITIPVDKNKTPSYNVKQYFKKYNKKKNTLLVTDNQKKETESELDYLESIIYELGTAFTVADLDEIYSEINENPIFERSHLKSKTKVTKSKPKNKKLDKTYTPIEYRIEDFILLVGKNNIQNDYLTTKLAKSNDIWFHTKDIHGSHAILQTKGKEPSIDILIRCAQIAAYYSKGKLSSNVPVDYTYVKYVKKPSGAKPGFVIYTHNNTINVTPKI